jgi:diaminopimelate decarboxylase
MGFSYKNGLLHADGVALDTIAARHGTPAYVYSAQQIADNIGRYQAAMDSCFNRRDYMICFATKSCSNIAILDLVHRLGCGADIVSGGEFFRTQKAGIPARKVVFSGVGKSDDEIAAAIKAGVYMINVESEKELRQIDRIAKGLKRKQDIAIRVNPNVDARTHAKITTGRKENKFGIDIDRAPRLYAAAMKMAGLKPVGIAVHIGSQLTQLAPFDRAYQRLAETVRRLQKSGVPISRIDAGGGVGISYDGEKTIDLFAYARIVKKHLGGLGCTIILEPGRSLSGNPGVLLTRVRFVKNGADKDFLILDAAMNDLMRPALYDSYHALWPVRQSRGSKKQSYDVVGPVCETGDTFMTAERLAPLNDGDLCALMNAGAYGASMSSTYNTRPLVPEILVTGNKTDVIRERQTLDGLIAGEKIPGKGKKRRA